MQFQDDKTKRSHVAKRLRIRNDFGRVIAKCDRVRDWIYLGIAVAAAVVLTLLVTAPSGNGKSFLFGSAATVAGIILCVVALFHHVWGWRLTLDDERQECVLRRTFLGLTYHKRRVSLLDGPVGPCTTTIEWKTNPSIGVIILFVVFLLLGPIGWLLGIFLGARNKERIERADFPAIFHYNEASGDATLLLVIEKPADHQRVLEAFAELMPDYVSTS